MKKFIYAVYDRISQCYEVSLVDFRDGKDYCAATRQAARAGKIGHDLDDVEVYQVGVFDNETGNIEAFEKPAFVLKYVEYADLADAFAARKAKEKNENGEIPNN